MGMDKNGVGLGHHLPFITISFSVRVRVRKLKVLRSSKMLLTVWGYLMKTSRTSQV